jgi:hypothetical protein
MKLLEMTVILAIILALCGIDGLAQCETSRTAVQGSEQKDPWKTISLGTFSFMAPKEVEPIKAKCIDSECHEFLGKGYRLGIDFSVQAFRPTVERK